MKLQIIYPRKELNSIENNAFKAKIFHTLRKSL